MKNRLRCLLTIALAVLLATTFGCSSTPKKKHSGFLEDYSMLKPVGKDGMAERYQKPDADLGKYNKLMIDRIMVWQKQDADYKGIDPTEMKAMTDYFYEAILKEFKDDNVITTEPGPDVLRIRIAITDLVPTNPYMSATASLVPYLGYADFIAAKTSGSFYIGEASIEAEVVDSQTSERLIALVERKPGQKYDLKMEKGLKDDAKQAADSYFKSFKTWGYAYQDFDFWAKKIRTRWDEEHKK